MTNSRLFSASVHSAIIPFVTRNTHNRSIWNYCPSELCIRFCVNEFRCY